MERRAYLHPEWACRTVRQLYVFRRAKNTVTVTLTDPEFKNLPALQTARLSTKVVLEGHFGPYDMTLGKTDGAIEVLTPFGNSVHGSFFPRICERSFVLLVRNRNSRLPQHDIWRCAHAAVRNAACSCGTAG